MCWFIFLVKMINKLWRLTAYPKFRCMLKLISHARVHFCTSKVTLSTKLIFIISINACNYYLLLKNFSVLDNLSSKVYQIPAQEKLLHQPQLQPRNLQTCYFHFLREGLKSAWLLYELDKDYLNGYIENYFVSIFNRTYLF